MEKLSARDRIIEAAYKLFSERGYHGTTTREIARAASVSEVTLFRIFGTKEALFEEVLKAKSIIPDLVAMLNELDHRELKDLLYSLAKKIYSTLVAKKRFIMITLSEVNQYSEKVINVYQKLINEIDDLLVKIFSKHRDNNRTADLKIVAMGFRGMIFDLFLTNEILLRKNISTMELEHVLSSYVGMVLNSIK